ncbi:hypothetical protein SERLA73DRAFT_179467 [Serpula lacrymans var. lacrymans S7.3]|uniref:Uncharacterized protein n=2 Tax=Serpula lacrymans var. lacrymans TaxID=341189 RepID=F8PSH5_SERL3|nr:uncharacterized protein SERLADRAFT_464610 [Serpula lacrymans var. lacrymans S7.9]EGO01305.1 hypothetical protein SERLA73DRAFT_179467 [Serpula lacrymans var. lacrymans S7.3]EGO26946.1 hypothetical protein SERLADRAFT_464610 [Serpula lacrymans var. lacrymans S7.9]
MRRAAMMVERVVLVLFFTSPFIAVLNSTECFRHMGDMTAIRYAEMGGGSWPRDGLGSVTMAEL